MRYFSMFSGIGGFELGIQNAYRSTKRGEQADSQRDQGQRFFAEEGQGSTATLRRTRERTTDRIDQRPLCIGYSEIDKYAIKVYERQFNGHKNYGDATNIDSDTLPDFDLLVGGFPCQAFSVAGKRGGFDDTRGTLFFDVARILADKRPRHLVLENVKGLLSHDGGKTFTTIVGVLADLGYRVEWQVLNSKDFGVPQNRERVYIVGHLGEGSGCQVFPIAGNNTENTRERIEAAGINNPSRGYEVRKDGLAGSLRATEMGSKNFIANRQNSRQKQTESNANEQPRGKKATADIRRLTPRECERLQAYPDNWTRYDPDGNEISDTQRYKMCGNAVTVNVVQAVMERLFEGGDTNG